MYNLRQVKLHGDPSTSHDAYTRLHKGTAARRRLTGAQVGNEYSVQGKEQTTCIVVCRYRASIGPIYRTCLLLQAKSLGQLTREPSTFLEAPCAMPPSNDQCRLRPLQSLCCTGQSSETHAQRAALAVCIGVRETPVRQATARTCVCIHPQ